MEVLCHFIMVSQVFPHTNWWCDHFTPTSPHGSRSVTLKGECVFSCSVSNSAALDAPPESESGHRGLRPSSSSAEKYVFTLRYVFNTGKK